MKVTNSRKVEVPVTLAGVVGLWVVAILLLTWETTDHGPVGAAVWGLLLTGVSVVWSLVYAMSVCLDRHLEMLGHAFRLGQGAEVLSLDDRGR